MDETQKPEYEGAALTWGGIDPALYNRLSPQQRSLLDLYAGKSQINIANGQRAMNVTPELLKVFYDDAANDPTINTYYKDQLALGQRELQMNLEWLNAADTIERQQIERQYEEKRLADDEAAAAAGTAYSSYRNRTDENRNLDKFGVTEINRMDNQKDAFKLGNTFEQNYGSANTPSISVGGQQYNQFGGQLGANEQNKVISIQNKAGINAANFATAGGLPDTTTQKLATVTPTAPKPLLTRGQMGYSKQEMLSRKAKQKAVAK